MTPGPATHWKKIEEIFSKALDLEPENRLAFLGRVCGEGTELRRRVEVLLEPSGSLP